MVSRSITSSTKLGVDYSLFRKDFSVFFKAHPGSANFLISTELKMIVHPQHSSLLRENSILLTVFTKHTDPGVPGSIPGHYKKK
jgi:hypothetical protein